MSIPWSAVRKTGRRRWPTVATFSLAILLSLSGVVWAEPQASESARVLFNVGMVMPDGVRLSADIYFPAGTGKFPAVLWRTPYDKSRYFEMGLKWAKYGYVFIAQDTRGRYDSSGVFNPLFDEGADGRATIRWIASQPWSDGKVGTIGSSYSGWVQWLAAVDAEPSLAAMVPIVAPPDPFLNVPYTNGALTFGLANWALLMDGRTNHTFGRDMLHYENIAAELYHADQNVWRLPVINYDRFCGRDVKWWQEWVQHNSMGSFWKGMTYQDKLSRISAPALNITGWYDVQLIGGIINFERMTKEGKSSESRKQMLLVGPWGHLTNQKLKVRDFGPQATIDLDAVLRRWYGYWLKAEPTGMQEAPPIQLFVMGRNEWQDEWEWPLKRTSWTAYYLHSAGKANTFSGDGVLSTVEPTAEPVDHYAYDPANPVLNQPPEADAGIGSESLVFPGDLRDIQRRQDVLVYQTPPLGEDVEVIGPVSLKLYASSSAPDTDWVARLSDVSPDGSSWALCGTILRARYRDSFEHPILLEPGKVYAYELKFWPTANRFLKGHRIRLDITSSAFPTFDRNLNTGQNNETTTEMQVAKQTIYHNSQYPSSLVLPVIPWKQRPTP